MGVSSLSASGPALAQNEALAPHERRSPGVSSLPLVQSSEVAEGPADNMAALAPADNENTPTAKVPTSPSQRHPETTSASPSPVSVTASGPYATNIRLSPDVEEEIKNAVLEAAAHSHKDTQRTSISGRHKIKMKQHRRGPDGRRESPRTTRNWLIAKKVLRWVSLTICGLMVVGETILAIFDGAYADTALGTSLVCTPFTSSLNDFLIPLLRYDNLCDTPRAAVGHKILGEALESRMRIKYGVWLKRPARCSYLVCSFMQSNESLQGFLLGIWDTVRLVRLRLKRDVEPVSVFHLVAEGTFTAAIIISFSCIVDQVRRYWAGQFMIRGWIFSSGMLLLE